MENFISIGMLQQLQGAGVDSEMISRAIENIGPSNIKIVSANLGETNLEVFRAATSSGLTKEQAVWATPLGKTMNALGFKNVEMSGAGSVSFSPFYNTLNRGSPR